eukprot:1627075-Pyramimonas_sp.AAC.1
MPRNTDITERTFPLTATAWCPADGGKQSSSAPPVVIVHHSSDSRFSAATSCISRPDRRPPITSIILSTTTAACSCLRSFDSDHDSEKIMSRKSPESLQKVSRLRLQIPLQISL